MRRQRESKFTLCLFVLLFAWLAFLLTHPAQADYLGEVEADEPYMWWRLDEPDGELFAENSGLGPVDGGDYLDVEKVNELLRVGGALRDPGLERLNVATNLAYWYSPKV